VPAESRNGCTGNMTLAQILAILIFLAMFGVITWGKVPRHLPAVVGAALVLLVVFTLAMKDVAAAGAVLNLGQFFEARFWLPGQEHFESSGINWQTIVFIGGMMVMVEGLSRAGFFRWLCLYTARLARYRVMPVFMVLSGFLSMFIASITVMLFLAAVTIEIARLLKFDPVPLIIGEISASNIGGAATMSGDPPNIIIGTSFGYTFSDFLANTGVIAWIGMVAVLLFFYMVFRRTLKSSGNGRNSTPARYPEPGEAIQDWRKFYVHAAIFLLSAAMLVTHARTGMSVAMIGTITAVLTLLAAGKDVGHVVKGIDWRTLVFFIGLFVVVGGLEETGVLKVLANAIADLSGGNMATVLTIILWTSAIASSFVDNIPFAATMVPVVGSLSQSLGLDLRAMSWSLALGTDIGGNGTPIGASANVVGTAISEREGHPIGWGRYLKYAVPAMVLVMVLCNVYLLLRY
jgi:Na+/H+ antiporter NhaD/arsenite permease-like protein